MKKLFELLIKWTEIKILKIFNCKYCWEDFPLYDLEKYVLDKQKFSYPDFCPTCRFRMLYSYINDKHLYNRIDDLSGKNIVSVITPEYEWKVYKAEEYKKMILDDYWLKFWREWWENILEDFKDLYKNFPKPSKLIYPELENAEYASHTWRAKDVYMSFCVFVNSENIYNSFNVIFECRNIFSSYDITKSSNIYNCWLVNSWYEISYSYNIFDSSNLMFCRNMQNCQECIFCCNQVNSKYKIYNKQYEKEEYLHIKKSISIKMINYDYFTVLENEYDNFLKNNLVEVSCNLINSEAVKWEKVYDSKNSINIYATPTTVEDCINLIETGGGIKIINSVASWLDSGNIVWSCSTWVNSFWLYFCYATVENCNNLYYCADMESCEECMFCMWLKNKKYHILNKWYNKERYFELKEKIINNLIKDWIWWKFLWFDFSCFPYNDTLSYDYFGINKVINFDWTEKTYNKDAKWIVRILEDKFISDAELDLWWREKIKIKWRTKNKDINIPEGIEILDPRKINSYENEDEILKKAIICETTWRPFKIIKPELEFIKKRRFPLPRIHPELRIDKLVSVRPLWQLFLWKSDKSREDILTVFKSKPDFKVYSPEEYRDFMFS